jgi:hypothetical protein
LIVAVLVFVAYATCGFDFPLAEEAHYPSSGVR